MANMFDKPLYLEDEPRRSSKYKVTEEDRQDPTLAGLTDEEIVGAKTPASDNLFETPQFETEEPVAAATSPEEPGLASKVGTYAGKLGYETVKGMGGATNRTAGALNTVIGAFPVVGDAIANLVRKHPSTEMQDWWFRTMVDPAVSEETQARFAPGEDFGSKAANAVGATMTTISQLVLTGGEAAPAAAASTKLPQFIAQTAEHGIKAMTVPAISEAVNTGREVYQKTGDASTAVAAAQTKYITTAVSGVMPLAVPGGVAARAATGAVSGVATGELDRTAQNAVLPGGMQREFSGEETALNAMTGAVMGAVMGPRTTPRPRAESPLSAVEEAQHDAAEKAKAKGGDTLDQVLAAARAGAEHSEEFAGAFYEHTNQVARARMADEAAEAAERELFGGLSRDEATAELAKLMAEAGEKELAQTAALDDTAPVGRAPRTPDEIVYQPPTGRKLDYERGFDQAEAERAAKAPEADAAKAKDYDEALIQREQQAAEQPIPAPKKPLATLADVAPENLFKAPVHEEPAVKPANLRETRRLRRLEKEASVSPAEQKLLPGPEKTGRILVDKEGTARPETGADVRGRTESTPTNLTLRREAAVREPLALKETTRPDKSEVKKANEEYARRLVTEELTRVPEADRGKTPEEVVRERNKAYSEQLIREEAARTSESVETAAHEAAPSPENARPEPTEAQYKAGNFKMGHTKVHGLDVTVEYPRGSKRPYTTAEGVKGEREMPGHYGYFKGTKGADGMHVDVLLGEHPDNDRAYVVDHLGTDGKFEQHKVLMGYRNQLEAVRAYKKAYPERTVGPVKDMSVDEMKTWLKGDTTKPVQPDKLGRAADRTEKTAARGSKVRYREGDVRVEEPTGDTVAARVEGEAESNGGAIHATKQGEYLLVKDAQVKPGLRGKGYGVKAYEALIAHAAKKGLKFGSDIQVSEAAQRIYEALKNRGYEVKQNPADRQASGELVSKSELKPVFEVTPPLDALNRLSERSIEELKRLDGDLVRRLQKHEISWDDYRKQSEPIRDALFKKERAAEKASNMKLGTQEVHPGFKRIPEGTKIQFSHGFSYKNAIGTVVGVKPMRLDQGKLYNVPLVEAPDGRRFTVAPDSIEKVFAPRIVKREGDATLRAPSGPVTDQINSRELNRVAVRKAVEPLNREMPGLKAEVHDNPASDSVPEHIRAQMAEDGQNTARAVYDPETDAVHIFADNHATPEDAVVSAIHEGVAHKGLRHLLADAFEPTMQDVFKGGDSKWLSDFIAQHGLDPKDPATRIIAAEEYAASIAERMDEHPTMLRAVIDAVRTALRKLGLVKKWTDADIQALLRKSKSGLRNAVARLRETDDGKLRYAEQPDKLRVDDDHPLAMAGKIGATVEEQANYNPGFVRSRIDALRAFGHNNIDKLLGAIPRDKLRDFVAPGKMPSTDAYTREVQKMDGRRNELMVAAEKTGKRWLKYNRKNPENSKTLSELMHAATIAGVEPANEYRPLYSSPKNLEQRNIEAQRKVQHARLRKFWNKLDGEGKALYIDVRESYAQDRDRIVHALEQRIQDSDAEGRAKASLIAELRTQFEKGRVAGPYFPLARFGKHWAVARDEAGEVVSFARFEKPAERDAWRNEMDQQGFTTDGGQKLSDDIAMAKALDPTFVAKITDLLREIDPSLSDDVWQHYLRTLPELSMRKHFIHRKGRLGFTGDALRAFGYQKFHSSHQIAKLEHMGKLEGHLEQMTVEARKLEEARDKESKWAVPILEEFKQRHEWARNPKLSPMSRALTSLGYAYYMAASPATAFVNLTQTAAVGLPVLSGEFNPASATAELMRATAQWAGSRGDFGNRLRGDERKAYDESASRGIYEKTQAHDLASIGEEGADFGSVRNQTMQIASFLFHHIERFNREATHIAAYRLGRKKGLSHEVASEKAIQLTNDSHFDYSNANRPRYMQGNAARVLLLFRNYAVNMTYRLARDFRNGIIRAGKTDAEKHGAFTRFAGMLGATMLQAGVTGLPMWWAAKKILNLVLGDEDTPFDAEAALYAHLSQQYGETIATSIMHGSVDALTPVTLSSRVGLNNMWVHDAPPNLDGRDEGLFYLQEAAGPVGGLVVKAAQAAALPSQGYADRALETLTPKAVGDVLKAIRYAREGVSDLQGHTLIPPEEITNADIFAQAVGFSPSHVTRVQEQNRNIKSAVGKLGDRRQLLINKLFMAAHADDQQGISEAMDAIGTFNEKNPRIAIRGENIVSSAKARARYSQQSLDGLRVEPNLRYLQEDLRFLDDKEK